MNAARIRTGLYCSSILLGSWFGSACSAPASTASSASPPSGPTLPLADEAGPAPSYTELFDTYFAPGTPGHCATAGCHADPGHNVWLCGTTRDTCYAGMLYIGLIDAHDPRRSLIANPSRSPLTWINATGGIMPLDAQGPNEAGRDAISDWVAAGAPDN
jgi:hypothetical protein